MLFPTALFPPPFEKLVSSAFARDFNRAENFIKSKVHLASGSENPSTVIFGSSSRLWCAKSHVFGQAKKRWSKSRKVYLSKTFHGEPQKNSKAQAAATTRTPTFQNRSTWTRSKTSATATFFLNRSFQKLQPIKNSPTWRSSENFACLDSICFQNKHANLESVSNNFSLEQVLSVC